MKRVSTYELSNHLGNVLTVITDRKIPVDANNDFITDYYLPDVISSTDYYAFGSPMPGRNFNAGNYRYGFNGKENDNETVSTGEGTQDYGMRIYNPALGRFLSVDPLQKEFAWNSSYAFSENDVIRAVDLDGAEKNFVFYFEFKGTKLKHVVPYSVVHPGEKNGPLGSGDYVMVQNSKTKQFSGGYVKSYQDAHPIRSKALEVEARYKDKKGFKKLGEDLSSASTYVKLAGVITVAAGAVTGQPEIVAGGIELYNIGDKMEDVADGVQVIDKVDDNKLTDAAVIVAGNAADKVVTGSVSGSEYGDDVQKFAGEVLGSETIDNVKDNALENNETKKKDE